MNIQLKTAAGYLRRSPFQTLSAVVVLTLTFFVATLVMTLMYSSGKLINYFETRPQIIAFLKSDATDSDISELQHRLSGDVKVKDIKYVSREEALSIYKNATSDNPLLGELVSPTIFPASLEFSAIDIEFADELINQIKEESIVDSVGFTAAIGGQASLGDVVGRLKTISNYIKIAGLSFTLILGVASFVLLLVIVTMRMATRREEIEILNLIGATQKFIRSPIILEAYFYSMAGVILGWMLAFATILFTAPSVVSYFGEISILPKGAIGMIELFGVFLGIEIIAGAVLATLGSLLAISRVKKAR